MDKKLMQQQETVYLDLQRQMQNPQFFQLEAAQESL